MKQHWGVSLDQTIGYHDANLYYTDLVLRGGVGFGLGPLGLGANISHTVGRSGHYDATPNEVFEDDLLGDVVDAASAGDAENYTAIGLGAMLNFDRLSAGLFLPDFMYAGDTDRLGGEDLLDRASVGIAYRPIHVRSGNDRMTILQFLVSADARNVGSDANRSIHLGAEADINLLIFGASARLGYIVPAASSNNQSNLVTFGISGDLLLANLDFGIVLPQELPDGASPGDVARYAFAVALAW